jgi:hypothetical protein
MVKRVAPVQVISFFLLAASGALCQSELPSVDFLQGAGSNSSELRRPETRTWRSLPDAPSVLLPTQAEKPQMFADEARLPSPLGAAGINTGETGRTGQGQVTPGPLPLSALYQEVFAPRESSTFFGKYLSTLLRKQNLRYHPSTSGSFMGRATYATSHIFTTRNDSGKRRLNNSYFLGVLSSVAIHAAYRPYWTRSLSAPFNDFGSTIGSDAGINLFHEFRPGIQQMVKSYTPKFASRIEEYITRGQNPRGELSPRLQDHVLSLTPFPK